MRVTHHEDVDNTIEEWQRKGWRLHTIRLQTVRQPSTITGCLKRANDAKNSPSARALMTVYLTRKELEALSAKNLNEETETVRKKHPRHVEYLLGMSWVIDI